MHSMLAALFLCIPVFPFWQQYFIVSQWFHIGSTISQCSHVGNPISLYHCVPMLVALSICVPVFPYWQYYFFVSQCSYWQPYLSVSQCSHVGSTISLYPSVSILAALFLRASKSCRRADACLRKIVNNLCKI